jgi:hypothetical protein
LAINYSITYDKTDSANGTSFFDKGNLNPEPSKAHVKRAASLAVEAGSFFRKIFSHNTFRELNNVLA